MRYTESELIRCLKQRYAWYNKAVAMKNGMIPHENGFDFPDGNIYLWIGARYEIRNIIDMMEVEQ